MKCPLADYCKKRNIACTLPLKQDKKKCPNCDFWRDGKCHYRQIMAEKERETMRGLGALTKQAIMKAHQKGSVDRETARKAEQVGLRLSGLSKAEEEEYWKISRAYDEEWEKADLEKRAELEWRMHNWQRFMENGYGPKEANELANEIDYSFKLKMDNVFKYLPEAYMLKGISSEKAESTIQNLAIWGGVLWIEAFQTIIDYHKYRYYTLDSPVISDAEYEWLKEQLREAKIQAEERLGRR